MWLDNIKEMKAKSGLTTAEIAEKSGIPEPTLEKLFAGTTKDPKLGTMQQLVHFFGHTLDDLDDEIKNSPSTDESAPGEVVSTMFDSLFELLTSTGLIREGQDITDTQAEVLAAVCRILNATFQ